MSANTNGDDGPELPFPEEHIEDDAAEQAKQVVQEQEEQADQARKEQYEQDVESAAGDLSTQQWLEQETSRDTDTFEVRGREFEFKLPGVLHRKRMIALASEQNPEEMQDIDPGDDEAVDEVLEETFDAEGLKTVDELYHHVLASLAELCTDPEMGDTSNIEGGVLESDELPAGAYRWGKLPEDDKDVPHADPNRPVPDGCRVTTDEETGEEKVVREGVSSVFRRVVMERGRDAEQLGN